MALIDVTAKLVGTSETVAQSGLRMSVSAALTGTAASGLGRQPAPQTQASEKKPGA